MGKLRNPKQPELFGPQYVASLDTPIGKLWVESDGESITRVSFSNPGRGRHARAPKVLTEAVTQLKAYFAERRKKFDLPLYQVGSAYRRKVWTRLGKIPYGSLATYADLAKDIGGAARSTGAACAVNPLLILVPCHRVVGSSGLLTGYAGGIWRKKWLLEHEGALAQELF